MTGNDCGRGRRRLRIALVIEDVRMGGGQERVIAEMAPRLAQRHEVHLFCFTLRDIDTAGLRMHRISDPSLPLGARALWFVIASSLAIRQSDFDVVLSQGGNTLAQSFVLVHTCHRDRRRARMRLQERYGRSGVLRTAWEALRDGIFARLEGRAVRRCRGRVIAVSQSIRDYLVRKWGLAPNEVQIVHNGVDHATFRPELRRTRGRRVREQLGIGPEELVAIFMGGLWTEKGLPELIEALSRTNGDQRLVVVGSGDAEAFGRMAEQHGVRERVTFVPHVDRPQDYLAMADCLVHPNPIEPFGLVVLEAAACGVPLLAARSGVAMDLIEDGVTGYFIEREPADIAAKLDAIADDPRARARMSERVHRRSLEFSWDRQADEMERIFLELTPERGERR